MTLCKRCLRPVWPAISVTEGLCWGGLQCDTGRLAALERALRAAAPFLPVEHPAVQLLAAPVPPQAVITTAKAAADAAHRRLIVEFPTGAEADKVRAVLAHHGYDPAKPSSLARALLTALARP